MSRMFPIKHETPKTIERRAMMGAAAPVHVFLDFEIDEFDAQRFVDCAGAIALKQGYRGLVMTNS